MAVGETSACAQSVCLCCRDDQSIIQEEPSPSVAADCICVFVFCFSLLRPSPRLPPPSAAANGNDSKKFKSEVRSPSVPSRVVHVRKLPNDINEAEVIGLGLPFGKVTNLLMLKGKNQVSNLHASFWLAGVFSCLHDCILQTMACLCLNSPFKVPISFNVSTSSKFAY